MYKTGSHYDDDNDGVSAVVQHQEEQHQEAGRQCPEQDQWLQHLQQQEDHAHGDTQSPLTSSQPLACGCS